MNGFSAHRMVNKTAVNDAATASATNNLRIVFITTPTSNEASEEGQTLFRRVGIAGQTGRASQECNAEVMSTGPPGPLDMGLVVS